MLYSIRVHHKFHKISNHFFSHLEVRLIISINVIQYIFCKKSQKPCYDATDFSKFYFIPKVSLFYTCLS